MADSEVWNCRSQSGCQAQYSSLFDLVSHMRSAHSDAHSIFCRVDGCQRYFKSSFSWYWHIRRDHSCFYTRTGKRAARVRSISFDRADESVEGDYEDTGGTDDRSVEDDYEDTGGTDTTDGGYLIPGQCSDANNTACESHQESQNVTIHAAKQEAMYIAMGWATKLRQIHHVTESALVDVMEMCKALQTQFLLVLKNAMANLPVHTECMEQFTNVMSDHSTWPYMFDRLKSPYQRLLYVKQNYPYVEPMYKEIGCNITSSDGFFYIPILNSIQALLNHPLVFEQVMSGPHFSDPTIMADVCDGHVFKNHPVFQSSETTLQIILYYDEFTAVNPMAPTNRKHKIGAIYFSLANIDPTLRSRLEAINLVSLFQYSLLDVYTIDCILHPIINDLKKLQQDEGYTFLVNGSDLKLKGAVICIVGDTPALSLIGGFKEGVGFANKKCRQCMADNDQIQNKFTEEDFVMRYLQDHLQQCGFIDRPGIKKYRRQQLSKVYGINRRSILCELPNFDITKHLPQDVMHVLFEGLFPLQIRLFLNYLCNDMQVLTLSEFNKKLRTFPYAYFEDKPHPLTPASLTNGIFGQTAHEMWQLFHITPFFVGDCLAEADEHLRCYLLLQEISSVLCTDVVTQDHPLYLRLVVQDYLTTMKKLYPSLMLPPKAHYLVHCPSLIMSFGPLSRIWSMRFEAKHREFKRICRKTSYKNLLKTLSTHHQSRIAYNLKCSSVFSKECTTIGSQREGCLLQDVPYASEVQELIMSVGSDVLLTFKIMRYSIASTIGITFRTQKCYLCVKIDEESSLPQFTQLQDILTLQDSTDIIFVVSLLRTVRFWSRFAAYECINCQKELHQVHIRPLGLFVKDGFV